jgi:hypothetical protein
MEKDDQIDEMTQAMANFAIDYADKHGLTHGDTVNAMGRLYVTYGFTVKGDKITNEALNESLVGFVDAACKLMVGALNNAKET